jgi:hypothetical protein
MIVGLASNASEATSSKTMGLLDATVSTNGFANVVTEGLLAGLDTSTAGTEGDPVWLGTGGNLIYGLANKPYAPAHLVFIGIVTRKNANNGEIFVKVQNGFELNEIHDVDLKTNLPTAGQLLRYNSDGLWKNWSPNYLTAESDTLATVTGRGATTSTPVTFNGNVTLGNSADLVFQDLAGTFPTSGKGFDWTLNNDGARIYAIQPNSDSIDFVFQLRDNATTNDRFVFWVDEWQGPAYDKYPLIISGGTEFDLKDSSLFTNTVLRLSNSGVLQNVTGNISMFTNNVGYLTSYTETDTLASVTARGATTSQNITINGQLVLNNGVGPGSGQALIVGGSGDVTLSDGGSLFFGAYDYGGSTYIRGYDNSNVLYFYVNGSNIAYLQNDRLYLAGTIFTSSHGNSSQWNTAYGWGNHASAGYLTSVTAHTQAWSTITSTPTTISGYGITNAYTDAQIQNFFNGANAITGYNKSNWDTAYGWGNHASAGYLTSVSDIWVNTAGDTMTGSLLFANNADNVRLQKGGSFLNLRDPWDNIHFSNNGGGIYVDSPIHYWRSASGSTYWMTLASGNLGIGTTSPGWKLHVAGESYTSGVVRIGGTSPLYFEDYGGGWYMADSTWVRTYNGKSVWVGGGLLGGDGGLTIGYGGTTPPSGGAIILSNVGIGTSSPSQKLHVVGNQYTTGNITVGASGNNSNVNFVRGDGSGVGGIGWRSDGIFYVGGHLDYGPNAGNGVRVYGFGANLSLGNNTAGDVLTVTNGGNVGIGTTSPSEKLHVVGKGIFESNVRIYPVAESWAEGLSFIMPTTSNWGGLRWQRQRGNNDGNWYIGFTALDSTDDLVFGANNGGSQVDNIIRLTKAGNVGIGTSAPTTKLDVRGNMLLKGDATDGGILTITRRYSTGAQTINFNNNHPSSNLDWTGARITSADSGQYNGYLDFAVSLGANGSEAAGTAAVASVMRLTKDGYVGIGTTTPSYKLHVNGTFGFAGSLYGDGKKAIDVYDSWLRLNQDGAFGSGVYTPYALRNDGAFDNYGGIYGYNTIRGRKAQTVNNYTTAALWTESYDITTTGVAFHISGVVGKFLEMRTNGILYWDNAQVWTASTLTNLNQLTNGPGYITGYTETDTLNSVTSRGASTSNAITVGATTINGIWQTNISTAGGWSKLSFTASNAWGDGTTYGVLGAGGGNEPGVMVYNMHATWAGSGQGAGIRMGRSGGVSSGAWYQVATMDSDEFMIAKNGQWSNGGIKITSGGELQHGNSGNKYWHAGNDGSGSGLDADLLDGQNSTEFLRLLSGGAEASLDSYTDNGFRSVSFAGHSQHLLSWNASGSTGTVQQLFHYGVPNNGWRIRNKTDNSSWSDWGYVVMASSNQGLISGTIATQSWVGSQSYATTSYVTTQINNLIAGAPGALDTLDELAAALGDDSNFATTVTNSIASKLSLSGGTMTGDVNWTQTDRGLTWNMNTDGAYIKFYNTGDGDANSRLEYATSDNGDEYHRWVIGGTEKMTLKSAGLTINGTITATGYNNTNWDTAYSSLANYLLLAGGTMSGSINMNGNNVINIGQVNATHAIFTNDGSSRVMYLRGSGNIIQFQNAAATDKWEIVGRDGEFYVYKSDGAGSGYKWRIDGVGNHTITGNLTVTGTITESSSLKLKENVETSEGNLEKVVNLRPVTYNKIGFQTTELGLIAEEVAEVYPEFVQYDENGDPIGVNYSRLTAALIGAVKELTNQVQELNKKING